MFLNKLFFQFSVLFLIQVICNNFGYIKRNRVHCDMLS